MAEVEQNIEHARHIIRGHAGGDGYLRGLKLLFLVVREEHVPHRADDSVRVFDEGRFGIHVPDAEQRRLIAGP